LSIETGLRLDVDWSKVLFSDESRFCFHSPDGRERIYRRNGDLQIVL